MTKAFLQKHNEDLAIKAYLPLISKIAYGYAIKNPHVSHEDLVQEGMIGAFKALKSTSKEGLKTFVRKHAEGAIKHYLRDKACSIKISHRLVEKQNKSDDEMSLIDNIKNMASLDVNINNDDNNTSLIDTLKGNDCNIDDKIDCINIINKLTDKRLKDIFILYHLEDYSLSEIASMLNTNKMNIQRNLKKATDMLYELAK